MVWVRSGSFDDDMLRLSRCIQMSFVVRIWMELSHIHVATTFRLGTVGCWFMRDARRL